MLLAAIPWGCAPGWYGAAPLALKSRTISKSWYDIHAGEAGAWEREQLLARPTHLKFIKFLQQIANFLFFIHNKFPLFLDHHRLPTQVDVRRGSIYEKGMADTALAVFSDIHSNLEAFRAVLADMKALKLRHGICLGDVVGYGADPCACVDMLRAMGCPVLLGNHDEAVASEAELGEMNHSARTGIRYARLKLPQEQRNWLGSLPLVIKEDDCEFVHGSLDSPSDWYYAVSPEDVTLHFAAQTCPICFCGHTHDPMFWHWNGQRKLTVRRGHGRIPIPQGGKTLINAGSVGQPRDGNPDACYVILGPKAEWVEFRRVSYDISKAKAKILKAGLPHFTADRLSVGK